MFPTFCSSEVHLRVRYCIVADRQLAPVPSRDVVEANARSSQSFGQAREQAVGGSSACRGGRRVASISFLGALCRGVQGAYGTRREGGFATIARRGGAHSGPYHRLPTDWLEWRRD